MVHHVDFIDTSIFTWFTLAYVFLLNNLQLELQPHLPVTLSSFLVCQETTILHAHSLRWSSVFTTQVSIPICWPFSESEISLASIHCFGYMTVSGPIRAKAP